MTWVRSMPVLHWKVIVFVGGCQLKPAPVETRLAVTDAGSPVNTICLQTADDVYPPVEKELLMWDWMSKNAKQSSAPAAAHTDVTLRYEYYVKMDMDTYFNWRQFQDLLITIAGQSPKDAGGSAATGAGGAGPGSKFLYAGLAGIGREAERHLLGLDGNAYCVGMAYIMNRDILLKMEKYWRKCIETTMPEAHSDTEIGRCIYSHTGKSCAGQPRHFKQVYHSRTQRGEIVSRKFHAPVTDAGGSVAAATFNKQMVLKFQQTPFSSHLKAAFLHSLKSSADFDRFHKQVTQGLRPPQPRFHPTYKEAVKRVVAGQNNSKAAVLKVFRDVTNEMKQSCTNNPMVQRKKYGEKIKPIECPLPLWKATDGIPKEYMRPLRKLPTTIVVTTKPASIDEKVKLNSMLNQLALFGIDSVKVLEVDTTFSRGSPSRLLSTFAAQEALAMADGYFVRGMIEPLQALLNGSGSSNAVNSMNSDSKINRIRNDDGGGGGGGGGGGSDNDDETLYMMVHASDVMHCNFIAQYKKQMESTRCAGHLRTQFAGGVLYLGAGLQMQPDSDVKNDVLDDLQDAKYMKRDSNPGYAATNQGAWDRSCYNIWDVDYGKCQYKDFLERNGRCTSTMNCFSALYHREALLEVVSMLKASFAEHPEQQPDQEFRQHVHAVSACTLAHELAIKGYVTRATLQDLVIVSESMMVFFT